MKTNNPGCCGCRGDGICCGKRLRWSFSVAIGAPRPNEMTRSFLLSPGGGQLPSNHTIDFPYCEPPGGICADTDPSGVYFFDCQSPEAATEICAEAPDCSLSFPSGLWAARGWGFKVIHSHAFNPSNCEHLIRVEILGGMFYTASYGPVVPLCDATPIFEQTESWRLSFLIAKGTSPNCFCLTNNDLAAAIAASSPTTYSAGARFGTPHPGGCPFTVSSFSLELVE